MPRHSPCALCSLTTCHASLLFASPRITPTRLTIQRILRILLNSPVSSVVIRGLRCSALLLVGAIHCLNFIPLSRVFPTPSLKNRSTLNVNRMEMAQKLSDIATPMSEKVQNYSFARFKIGHTPRKNRLKSRNLPLQRISLCSHARVIIL